MRTLGKTLEYLFVAGLGSAMAYMLATTVASGVSDTFNHTAQCLEKPTKENCQ